MRAKMAILLVAVAAMLSTMKGAEALVCDNESRVNISIIHGLHHRHVLKEIRINKFEREVNETEDSVAKLQARINYTRNEAMELLLRIKNMTTPELEQLAELQICSEEEFVTDCCQIKQMLPSARSGYYSIKDPCAGDQPFSLAKLAVYCDMETAGGGWIVIQRRNASMGWVNFFRSISDYEKGFGDLDGEFWIGLEKLYELTYGGVALKVRVWDDSGNSANWNYGHFRISDKSNRYSLSLSSSSGDGSYSVFGPNEQNRYQFTTFDLYSGQNNCGLIRQSGWWYYNGICNAYANLNGRHQPSGFPGAHSTGERLFWLASGRYRIYTYSEMKIRPRSCNLN